jgi:putative ABC transport system permease protein
VRREISRVDPDIAIQGAETMDAVVRGSLAQPQLLVRVVALFATLALLLAAVGLYGVMAYSVAERTREFGVRMALGATPRDILGSVLKEGMGLALAGVAAGLVLSLWLTQLLAGLLFGVSATDPVTFGGAGCILVATALLASYMPARRSLRLDPVRALRDD